jgi:hypothetical protein
MGVIYRVGGEVKLQRGEARRSPSIKRARARGRGEGARYDVLIERYKVKRGLQH